MSAYSTRKRRAAELDDDDYVPFEEPTPRTRGRARRRVNQRAVREVRPTDEQQEGIVIRLLSQIVSLTDEYYAILSDQEEDETTDNRPAEEVEPFTSELDDEGEDESQQLEQDVGNESQEEGSFNFCFSADEGFSQAASFHAYDESSQVREEGDDHEALNLLEVNSSQLAPSCGSGDEGEEPDAVEAFGLVTSCHDDWSTAASTVASDDMSILFLPWSVVERTMAGLSSAPALPPPLALDLSHFETDYASDGDFSTLDLNVCSSPTSFSSPSSSGLACYEELSEEASCKEAEEATDPLDNWLTSVFV